MQFLQEQVDVTILSEIILGIATLVVALWHQRRRIVKLFQQKPKPWASTSSHTRDHLQSSLSALEAGEVRLYIYHNGSDLPARLRSAGMARASVKFPSHVFDKELTPYNMGLLWPYTWQNVPYVTTFGHDEISSELLDLAEANGATAVAAQKIMDLNGRGLGVLLATWSTDCPLRDDEEAILDTLDLCATRIGGSLTKEH